MKCSVCEHRCAIPEGGTGICRMYTNTAGKVHEKFPDSYLTVMPVSIETIPLLHFTPRAKLLQVSSVGCTFTCPGCVSGVLIGDIDSIAGALRTIPPEELVARAQDEGCSGIVFCLNEPAVALPSFIRLAREAKGAGLATGCSTNGYFTEEALEELMPVLDFVNIGLKGVSDTRYRACRAAHAAPVYRNIAALVRAGVHVEASIMYLKGGKDEVLGAARLLAGISPAIPLQVMRFVPFGDAGLSEEPTILESEELCDVLHEILPWVYLFNSPGTRCLDTVCPSCGETIFAREFYGPMGARTIRARKGARCSCGVPVPVIGETSAVGFDEPGMLGGYRPTRALEMAEAIRACLGSGESPAPSGFWRGIATEEFIGGLHDRIQTIDGYLGLVEDIGARCGRSGEAAALRDYMIDRIKTVQSSVSDASRPRVYYSMGTPLFALNAGRFEVCLAETGGGNVVNRQIMRKGKPGVNLSLDEFTQLNPSIIFISGFLSAPPEDYLRTSRELGLAAEAMTRGAVYTLPPGWDFGSPRFVLGLMAIANILHPDRCSFNLDAETSLFYQRFYGRDPETARPNRSFCMPKSSAGSCHQPANPLGGPGGTELV